MNNAGSKSIIIIFSLITKAQISQKIDVDIDSVGNAKFSMNIKMNAEQWDIWNSSYGNNPAMLKREIERGIPAYFLDDFNLDKNDMERSFLLEFNGYGVCKIDKKGKWSIDTICNLNLLMANIFY